MICDIQAPTEVPEGTSTPIEVRAPNSRRLTVVIVATGQLLTLKPDDDGSFLFELPANAPAGTTVLIGDDDDPTVSTSISITPASAP